MEQKQQTVKQVLLGIGDNHAGVMRMTDGSDRNYGSIRVQNEDFVYYTGKGLREMWPQQGETEEAKRLKLLDEASLIKSQHIAVTPLFEIAQVIS
jgi:hypothetical protein